MVEDPSSDVGDVPVTVHLFMCCSAVLQSLLLANFLIPVMHITSLNFFREARWRSLLLGMITSGESQTVPDAALPRGTRTGELGRPR